MAISSRQIGGVEISANSSSTTYTIDYFVVESELSSYLPSVGDVASWAPAYAKVDSFTKSWFGPGCWKIKISATAEDSDDFSSKSELSDIILKSYSISELYFQRQWWGARLATQREAGYSDSGSGLLTRSSDDAFLDCLGNAAESGSLLLPGASKDSKGEPNYALCPFEGPSSSSMPVSLIEQKLKTKVYNVTYYSSKPINNISEFFGVSGDFSGSCRPSPSGSGKWRADFQSLDTVKDSKGKTWTKVVRRMTMAPGSLKWDSDKNGGTWSW